jgi:hypothetical protein
MANFDGNIVVNISLSAAPVTQANFSTPLIAGTSMTAGFTERIRRYSNAAAAAADTDLSAGLIARVTAAFSQNLKPSEVAVGRVDGATVDDWNIDTLGVGTIGDTITVTILGTDFLFTSATGSETPTQITTALIALMPGGLPFATVDNTTNFDVVGTNAGQPLEVTVAVTGTATAVATNTTPAVTMLQELGAVLAEDSAWYRTILESRAAWDILQMARFCEANHKLGYGQTSDADVLTTATDDILSQLQDLSFTKVTTYYFSNDNEYLDVALASDRSVVNPDLNSTIDAYVTLVGVTPDDDNVTDTQKSNVEGKNGNLYLTAKSVGATGPGKVASGEWVDVLVAADWLRARLAEDATQVLLNASNRGEKVPYTDQGINIFAGVAETRLRQGEVADHFIDDTSEVNPPLLSSIAVATRQARELTIPFSTQPAGAIQFTTFNGYISLTA